MVTMLPGSGIGPELMKHVRDVFRLCFIPVDFEIIDKCDGHAEIVSIKRNGVGIKGKHSLVKVGFRDVVGSKFLWISLDWLWYIRIEIDNFQIYRVLVQQEVAEF